MMLKTVISIFVIGLALTLSFNVVSAQEPKLEPDQEKSQEEDLDNGLGLTNEDAIAEVESLGFTVEGDKLLDQDGKEMQPNTTGEIETENSAGISEDGEALDPNMALENDLEENAACNYWWVHGSHGWNYKTWYNYTYAKFLATTWSTYGTAWQTCGIPLRVDRLYTKATIGSGIWRNFSYSQTGYNTSRISKLLTVRGWNIGRPCGMYVYHEALNSGIKWYSVTKSGCYR